MTHVHAPKKTPAPSTLTRTAAPSAILQRTCACGKPSVTPTGECEDCAAKQLQKAPLTISDPNDHHEREAENIANTITRPIAKNASPTTNYQLPITPLNPSVNRAPTNAAPTAHAAPPIVHSVLNSPGAPLDAATRNFFEPRLGHNFADVRIHTDTQASRSAHAVDARAYTVGNHLVFANNHYAPHTPAGRHLLAHELTHVIQQGPTLRRSSISHLTDDEQKPLQKSQLLQRAPAIVGLDEAGPNADLTGQNEADMMNLENREKEQQKKYDDCITAKGADPLECDHVTPLSWSDFQGTPKPGSKFSAETDWSLTAVDVPTNQCTQIARGYSSGPEKRYQAKFLSGASWVKSEVLNAADPTKNGSQKIVADCHKAFDDAAANKEVGTWFADGPDPACPAGTKPAGTHATTKAECDTVVKQDFTATAVADSPRLLNHEQNHYNLTCALAKKANSLLVGGTKFSDIDKVVQQKLDAAQKLYDAQAVHGCSPTGQAKWETEIANGLPSVKLPCDPKTFKGTCPT